jgi:diguanylate cyclase (GGDEF)-like protein/PAS domain S-box-containing protein
VSTRDRQIEAAGSTARRQQRRLLLVAVGLMLALGISLVVAARLLTGSFAAIEATATEQKAQQLYRAFNSDLRQLAISTRDYAEWDSAADFVNGSNPTFLVGNFTRETMSSMHVDLVWIVARDGAQLYSAFFDAHTNRLIEPAPPAMLAELRRVMRIDATMAERQPAERLLRTSAGPLAFSVKEIRRTDLGAPTGALMMFARYIDGAAVGRVGETLRMAVQWHTLSSAPLAARSAEFPAAIRSWIARRNAGSTMVWNTGSLQTTAYAMARDIDGQPLVVFSSIAPRSIYRLGLRTTGLMLGSIALLLIIGSSCVLWLGLRLQRSFAATHAAEQRYARIAAQLHEAITLAEPGSGRIVEANEAVLRAMGCTLERMRMHTIFELYPDLTPEALDQVAPEGSARLVLESRMRNHHGAMADAEIAITRMTDSARTLWCLVGRDVSHRREAEMQQRASHKKLVHIAQHDPLTGLPNRLYLRARLPRALRHAASSERLLALIYLDIDHFKNINDSRGHGAGDALLQIIAKRLRATVAAQDVVLRMGGDEFVIVAALLPNVEAVHSLARRLLAAIQAPLTLEAAPLEVSASLGIALYPNDGLDMESLLKHADIALYQAKAAGRRCHRLFSPEMLVRVSESVAMEQALRRAIGTDQFSMDYQPVIDMQTGQVSSLEALMRWRHPDLGQVPPGQFIPVADSSGLTVELGVQGLRIVLAQLRAWQDAAVPVVPVAVNISPVQLEQSDFCSSVLQLATEHQVDPRWLHFEITETALLKDPAGLVGTLQTLRALGSKVLIDDFGTGYSGLSYLARLPVDCIKIDRSFISELGKNTARTPIIDAVIELARKLNMTIVAEGVETRQQATLLRAKGCDYAQGFFYSRPVSARHCRALLEKLRLERPLTETLVARVLHSA